MAFPHIATDLTAILSTNPKPERMHSNADFAVLFKSPHYSTQQKPKTEKAVRMRYLKDNIGSKLLKDFKRNLRWKGTSEAYETQRRLRNIKHFKSPRLYETRKRRLITPFFNETNKWLICIDPCGGRTSRTLAFPVFPPLLLDSNGCQSLLTVLLITNDMPIPCRTHYLKSLDIEVA